MKASNDTPRQQLIKRIVALNVELNELENSRRKSSLYYFVVQAEINRLEQLLEKQPASTGVKSTRC